MKKGHYLIAAALLFALSAAAFHSPEPIALVVAIFAPMLALLMVAGAFSEENPHE